MVQATPVERDAERELCHRYASRIRGYGLRHLRDGHAADDLVQHVLLALLTAVREGREVMSRGGDIVVVLQSVPFDPHAGEVLMACRRHYQAYGNDDAVFRVHAVEGGERHQVGDYWVMHHWE